MTFSISLFTCIRNMECLQLRSNQQIDYNDPMQVTFCIHRKIYRCFLLFFKENVH